MFLRKAIIVSIDFLKDGISIGCYVPSCPTPVFGIPIVGGNTQGLSYAAQGIHA
jgi:hypothetical protein